MIKNQRLQFVVLTHSENFFNKSEELKIIKPAIKALKKEIEYRRPYPADTIFMKNNIKKYGYYWNVS